MSFSSWFSVAASVQDNKSAFWNKNTFCGGSKTRKERDRHQICTAISRKKEVDERKVVKNICYSALKKFSWKQIHTVFAHSTYLFNKYLLSPVWTPTIAVALGFAQHDDCAEAIPWEGAVRERIASSTAVGFSYFNFWLCPFEYPM